MLKTATYAEPKNDRVCCCCPVYTVYLTVRLVCRTVCDPIRDSSCMAGESIDLTPCHFNRFVYHVNSTARCCPREYLHCLSLLTSPVVIISCASSILPTILLLYSFPDLSWKLHVPHCPLRLLVLWLSVVLLKPPGYALPSFIVRRGLSVYRFKSHFQHGLNVRS
jgi:hypothetical protein